MCADFPGKHARAPSSAGQHYVGTVSANFFASVAPVTPGAHASTAYNGGTTKTDSLFGYSSVTFAFSSRLCRDGGSASTFTATRTGKFPVGMKPYVGAPKWPPRVMSTASSLTEATRGIVCPPIDTLPVRVVSN